MVEKQKVTKAPQGLFSDKELSLIKQTFAGNEELPIMIRKAIIQWPLLEGETKLLYATFPKGSDSLKLLRKVLLPEINGDAPIGQLVDMWIMLKLDDKSIPSQALYLRSREIVVNYLNKQFEFFFEGGKKAPFTLDSLLNLDRKADEEIVRDVIARNTITLHTDFNLQRLIVLAGNREETETEQKSRLEKDSNK